MTQPVYTASSSIAFFATPLLSATVLIGLLPLAAIATRSFCTTRCGMQVPEADSRADAPRGSRQIGAPEGVNIAREMLEGVARRVAGAYIMPPLERSELAPRGHRRFRREVMFGAARRRARVRAERTCYDDGVDGGRSRTSRGALGKNAPALDGPAADRVSEKRARGSPSPSWPRRSICLRFCRASRARQRELWSPGRPSRGGERLGFVQALREEAPAARSCPSRFARRPCRALAMSPASTPSHSRVPDYGLRSNAHAGRAQSLARRPTRKRSTSCSAIRTRSSFARFSLIPSSPKTTSCARARRPGSPEVLAEMRGSAWSHRVRVAWRSCSIPMSTDLSIPLLAAFGPHRAPPSRGGRHFSTGIARSRP